MAIIASHFEITVKVVDAGANFATLRYQMRDALYANVVIAKSTIVAALDAVTDCVIQRVSINEIWRNDAFAYPTEVKVSDKLSMTSELTGGLGKKANIKVPGPVDALFGAEGTQGFNVLDTDNALILTYHAMFEAAGIVYVSDGEDAETLISGKRISAKSYSG